jgi:hypothetical protein
MTNSSEQQDDIDLVRQILQQPSEPQGLLEQRIKDIEADRKLRQSYASKWFWVVVVQLLFVNVFFVLTAIMQWQIDPWTMRIFISATLAEAFGIVLVITRNLFPKR